MYASPLMVMIMVKYNEEFSLPFLHLNKKLSDWDQPLLGENSQVSILDISNKVSFGFF